MRGYMRCEYISPNSGQQCEVWFPSIERQKDNSGNLLPILCPDCAKIANPSTQKTAYIEAVNVQKLYCYKMFEKGIEEGFSLLDEHIAKIEAAIQEQKDLLWSARAVRAEKEQSLSESEYNERRKYKVKVAVDKAAKPKTVSMKKDPIAALTSKIGDKQKAADLLSMDPDEFIAKYQAKRKKRS